MRRGRIIVVVLLGMLLAGLELTMVARAQGDSSPAGTLFFSEYVEGSGYNKGLEIYNATGGDVDLTGYEIQLYRDGSATVAQRMTLSGVLARDAVLVVAHTSAAFAADFRFSGLNFNGDDGIALVKDGQILDFIGDTLGDPGSQWGSGTISTKDHTLRRKCGIISGDTNPNDPFNPAQAWDGYPKDDFDGLGAHNPLCATPVSSATPTPSPTLSPTATPTPDIRITPSATPTPTPIPTGVVINEYMPAPASGQSEYIELFNTNGFAVDLSGWQLDDMAGGSRPYILPSGATIAPGGWLLFRRTFGLNNGGDDVRLLAPDGSVRDSHHYDHARKGGAWSRMGDGAAAWTEKYPPSPGAANRPAQLSFSGHLYQGLPPDRSQIISDHNIGLYGYDAEGDAQQWLINGYVGANGSWRIVFDTAQGLYFHYILRPAPHPSLQSSGVSSPSGILMPPDRIRYDMPASGVYDQNDFWMMASPPTPTPVHLAAVRLNEFMPSPKTIDFDGDGEANYLDEFIELYNLSDVPVDISRWRLDDRADGGARPYTLPEGSQIPAHGFLLFFRKETGIALNNDGDSVRLLGPDGITVADSISYDHSWGDRSWARTVDGTGAWQDDFPPSPGSPNIAPTVTPTPTITPTPATSPAPSSTLTPTPTITPTPTASPTPVAPGFVTLNEFLPAPKAIDFNGDGQADSLDEYIELFNPQPFAIDLSGWALDDRGDGGSKAYQLPTGTRLDAGAFMVFFRSETGVALNNDADTVRLLAPDGSEIDSFAYRRAADDQAWSRTVDGVGGWTTLYRPSPGGPNIAPPPTPTPWPTPAPGQVTLNEILPAPRDKDWDGDGTASYIDEWIELYHSGVWPADVSGWRLWRGPLGPDGLPTGAFYQFPPHTTIAPNGYLLVFRKQSRLALPAANGELRLMRPAGQDWLLVDSVSWRKWPDYDRSFSRYPQGTGPWLRIFVTPGGPNRPFPTPAPRPNPMTTPANGSPQPIASAYALPLETKLTLTGIVTVAPGMLNARILYLQTSDAGLRIYLRHGAYPPLTLGDRLRVTGYVKLYHGQRELLLPDASWLTVTGTGDPIAPHFMRTGLVTSKQMGQLLQIAGRVTKISADALWVDDSSGPIQVQRPHNAAWSWPAIAAGQTVAATGVVASYDGVLHLLPRSQTDISPPPGVLPTTGGRLNEK